jgi:hypothetical protein
MLRRRRWRPSNQGFVHFRRERRCQQPADHGCGVGAKPAKVNGDALVCRRESFERLPCDRPAHRSECRDELTDLWIVRPHGRFELRHQCGRGRAGVWAKSGDDGDDPRLVRVLDEGGCRVGT